MRDTKKTTLTGMFIAIIFVMTFVPYTGYINYGGISITTIHIPVIIGAIALGYRGGILLGLFWGGLNLVKAYISGDAEALIFMNPLISVAPRILTGFIIGSVADMFRGKLNITKYSIMCGVIGSLSNTILVITAIGLFAFDEISAFGDTIALIFQIIVSVNGFIELGLAIFLTPIIVKAINNVYPINIKESK